MIIIKKHVIFNIIFVCPCLTHHNEWTTKIISMNPLQSASESNWSCMTWTQTLYPVALTCSDPTSFLSFVVKDYAVNNRALHRHKRAHTCTSSHTRPQEEPQSATSGSFYMTVNSFVLVRDRSFISTG